ncbi:hypothetical protein Ciccas_012859 [Cichlidogyrus casuarinus]|uniref:U6 snRNA phosphodiesterase n=1 Tax=Cichlidogyrus casuarinus TaxID=1844966 RepID=A0ABD2PQ77_9PLAT
MDLTEVCIFLCPSEKSHALDLFAQLLRRLSAIIGWNAAFDYPPHITLLPFSQLNVTISSFISKVNGVIELASLKCPWTFSLNCRHRYLGFDIEDSADLASFRQLLFQKLSPDSVSLDNKPPSSFHLSVAYNFTLQQWEMVKKIYYEISPQLILALNKCCWQLKIFSRSAFNAKQDYHVFQRLPRINLHSALECNFSEDKSKNGNSSGYSSHHDSLTEDITNDKFADAELILVPVDNTKFGFSLKKASWTEFDRNSEQCTHLAQHTTWQLLECFDITSELSLDPKHCSSSSLGETKGILLRRSSAVKANTSEQQIRERSMSSSCLSFMLGKRESRRSQKFTQRLFVMRHADRMDNVYGEAWVTICFDSQSTCRLLLTFISNTDQYRAKCSGMPVSLPHRDNIDEYFLDCPITVEGQHRALNFGRQLADRGFRFDFCYTSPALRCVQTAFHLLQGKSKV